MALSAPAHPFAVRDLRGRNRGLLVEPYRRTRQRFHPDPATGLLQRIAAERRGHGAQQIVRQHLLFDRRKRRKLRRVIGGIDRVERILILHLDREHAQILA